MALSEVAYASSATSRASRRVGAEESLTDSWLHLEASPARPAAVESLVMLPVLVLASPVVQRRRYCHPHHRPEADHDATNCSCPQVAVVLCSAGCGAVGCTVVDWRRRRRLGVIWCGVSYVPGSLSGAQDIAWSR